MSFNSIIFTRRQSFVVSKGVQFDSEGSWEKLYRLVNFETPEIQPLYCMILFHAIPISCITQKSHTNA